MNGTHQAVNKPYVRLRKVRDVRRAELWCRACSKELVCSCSCKDRSRHKLEIAVSNTLQHDTTRFPASSLAFIFLVGPTHRPAQAMPPKLKKVDSDKSQRSISAWLQKRAPNTAIEPESQPPSSPRTRLQRLDGTTARQPSSTGPPPLSLIHI